MEMIKKVSVNSKYKEYVQHLTEINYPYTQAGAHTYTPHNPSLGD